MKQMSKKKLICGIIGIALFAGFIIISTFTYAFFAPEINKSKTVNVISNIATAPSFVSSIVEGNIELDVSTADMLIGEANDTVPADESYTYITTRIDNESNKQFTCQYDIVWTDTSATHYTPSSGLNSKKEYTIQIDLVNTNNSLISNVYPETQILSSQSGTAIVKNQSIQVAKGNLTKKYKITMRLYNLTIAQNIYDKTYTSKFKISNVRCSEA